MAGLEGEMIMSNNDQPKFLIGRVKICKHFGIGKECFYEWIKLGMPHKKIANRYFIWIENVEKWLKKIAG